MINPIKAEKSPVILGILQTPNESRTVEFKPSIPWPSNIEDLQANHKAQEVIKSIIAMSNLRDGGKILLGIEKSNDTGNHEVKGMSPAALCTYDQDIIFEQIRNFGEPEPRFQILNVEFNKVNIVVFAVQSFVLAPVICQNRRNLNKLENAAIYIRTDKPETKKITDPVEMKELIDFAIAKELDLFSTRMQRLFKTMSSVKLLKSTDIAEFEDELKDVK